VLILGPGASSKDRAIAVHAGRFAEPEPLSPEKNTGPAAFASLVPAQRTTFRGIPRLSRDISKLPVKCPGRLGMRPEQEAAGIKGGSRCDGRSPSPLAREALTPGESRWPEARRSGVGRRFGPMDPRILRRKKKAKSTVSHGPAGTSAGGLRGEADDAQRKCRRIGVCRLSRRSCNVPGPVRWPMTDDPRRMWLPLSLPWSRWCTDARKTPGYCHFVPLFCALYAARSRRVWLGKSMRYHEIGPEVWAAGRSPGRVA
jgi:hypothetical protein